MITVHFVKLIDLSILGFCKCVPNTRNKLLQTEVFGLASEDGVL